MTTHRADNTADADAWQVAHPREDRPGTHIAVKVIDRASAQHMTVLEDPRNQS